MTSGKVPLAAITKILKRSEMWGDLAEEWVGSKLGSRLLSHSARGTGLESKTPAVHAQLLPCLKNKLFVLELSMQKLSLGRTDQDCEEIIIISD